MMEKVMFHVLHLDDQLDMVAWIPRAISSWFWKHFPEDMRELAQQDTETDDETDFVLRLQACGEHLDTRYRIICSPEDLIGGLDTIPADRVVLILLDQAIGANHAAGSDTWRHIEKAHPEILDRVFILTAYPNLAQGQLGRVERKPNLIIKPACPEQLITRFVSALIATRAIRPETARRLQAANSMTNPRSLT